MTLCGLSADFVLTVHFPHQNVNTPKCTQNLVYTYNAFSVLLVSYLL